ncbi:MAG: nuclear transport factor 2 family protein [Chloroflexi bacterium]|nr:nuclear transport factor 2 family protein [Chloroflexota bacterium]
MSSYETEKPAIQKAILDYYHEGHAKCDYKFYENILHPEWKFFMLDQGQLKVVDRDEYYSWYNPENIDPELVWETEFHSVDVMGNVAAVKIKLECQKVKYTDFFNMMKLDGQWWIMHKISHGVRKDE